MNILKHWKIVVLLLGIIVGSGLAGSLLGHRIARRQIEARNDPENWNIRVGREFDRMVKPTPEQQPRLGAHLNKAVRELQKIRKETIARSAEVIERLIAEVERELTPEQLKAFQALKPKPSDLNLDVLRVGPEEAESNSKPSSL